MLSGFRNTIRICHLSFYFPFVFVFVFVLLSWNRAELKKNIQLKNSISAHGHAANSASILICLFYLSFFPFFNRRFYFHFVTLFLPLIHQIYCIIFRIQRQVEYLIDVHSKFTLCLLFFRSLFLYLIDPVMVCNNNTFYLDFLMFMWLYANIYIFRLFFSLFFICLIQYKIYVFIFNYQSHVRFSV